MKRRIDLAYLEEHPFTPLEEIPTGVLEKWYEYNQSYYQMNGEYNMGPGMMIELSNELWRRRWSERDRVRVSWWRRIFSRRHHG